MSTLETALSTLPYWPFHAQEALKDHWLTTAEQVVALGNTDAGRKKLADITSLELDTLVQLLAQTRESLSEDVLHMLDAPVAGYDYGLGALPPPTRGQR